MRILVTPRSLTESPHPAVAALSHKGIEVVYCRAGQQPDEAELLSLVPGIDGWLAGVEPISDKVIAAANHLRCISRNGVGIDNLPMATLKARGIAVATTGGANAPGVAELTIGLMFAALRQIPATDSGVKAGRWPRLRGAELRSKTVAVIGYGAVGREVARLAKALGADVMAHDPFAPDMPGVKSVSLIEALHQADVLSLHCPPPPNGAALLAAEVLQSVRPGLILINTARAGLVDEAALAAALDRKQVACYAADVFLDEPPHAGSLAFRPDVIATSHIGGYTTESVNRATEMAVDNLLAALALPAG